MFEKNAEFATKPSVIEFIALPDGVNDIWLRKNIRETTHVDTTTEDNKREITVFAADEVYMRTKVTKAEIEANFDKWFEIAKEWKPQQDSKKMIVEDRMEALEQILMKNVLAM